MMAMGCGCLVVLAKKFKKWLLAKVKAGAGFVKHKILAVVHKVRVCIHKIHHGIVTNLRKLPCCKCLPVPPPPPAPPVSPYLSKKQKKAAALKFGLRWREETARRKYMQTESGRLEIKVRAVRVAGKFQEPISPERLKAGADTFSPHRLQPLAIRAPPVSPEKVKEFRLYKTVTEKEDYKEQIQRPMIHKFLKQGTTQGASLKAWAAYRGWSDPRAGDPSSWAVQEAQLAKKLTTDAVWRAEAKEARAKAVARQEREATEKEVAALSAEQELAEARAQIMRLTQEMHAGKTIADARIGELEGRLDAAESAMVAVDPSAAPPGSIKDPEEAEMREAARKREKEEMKKRLDEMGVSAEKPSFANGLKSAVEVPVWGLHQKYAGDGPRNTASTGDGGLLSLEAAEAAVMDDDEVSPTTKKKAYPALEEETQEFMKLQKERQRQERVQQTLDFRAAEMRRQVESMKVAATTADDGADDGGFSDEFESLFNSLKDQFVEDELVLAHKRNQAERHSRALFTDSEEEGP